MRSWSGDLTCHIESRVQYYQLGHLEPLFVGRGDFISRYRECEVRVEYSERVGDGWDIPSEPDSFLVR